MTAQNYTLRLGDELREWLERHGRPKARQLAKDLEDLKKIIAMARMDQKVNALKLGETLKALDINIE